MNVGKVYFNALEPLSDADLERQVTIRGELHSVMQAVNRQIAHYAYHCGQLVFLAKHFKSKDWKSLSVPRTNLQNLIVECELVRDKPSFESNFLEKASDELPRNDKMSHQPKMLFKPQPITRHR